MELIKITPKRTETLFWLYKKVAYPNFSLEYQWNKGEEQKLLAKEKWDYVIMQQGPSAYLDGRRVLIEYAKKFAEPIARAGAKPALYMVWSSAVSLREFAGVSANYKAAAKEVNGLFFPAGEAWLEAWLGQRCNCGWTLPTDCRQTEFVEFLTRNFAAQ